MQNFQELGAPPPDPQISPPLRIPGYAPAGYVASSRDEALCDDYIGAMASNKQQI